MPRQFGHRDRSADGLAGSGSWACRDCLYRHAPGSWCPPPGKWLVLLLCTECDDRTGYYCAAHRGKGPTR